MLKKFLCTLAMPATLAFAYAVPAVADVPPPPVNQLLGIDDTVLNNLVEAQCRVCHEDPDIVDGANIPNRHHLLVANPAETINCDYTAAIFADCPTDNGKLYDCYDCHQLNWNGSTYVLDTFRDCLYCHNQIEEQASVHHTTVAAATGDCKACHGPIDNPGDGHDIPTYDATMITPNTGLGTGPNGQGGCAFCHGPVAETPALPPLTDTESGVLVYSNADTHHGTGVILGPYPDLDPDVTPVYCTLCHNVTDPNNPPAIRGCEVCHGVNSLHNIQVDSNGDGVVPFAETAYWGHIGAIADCNGCHLNAATSASPVPPGSVIPDISGVNPSTVTAGFNTQLTITGAAFTNVVQGPDGPIEITSTVRLKVGDSETALTPDSITEDTIVLTVPKTMALGNYALSVVKGDSASNSVNLSVMPEVKITSASCSNGIFSIIGSGFSQYVNATGSGTSVSLPGVMADCSVLSWSDTAIGAKCGVCDPAINVDSVFGEASSAVIVKQTVIRRPSRR